MAKKRKNQKKKRVIIISGTVLLGAVAAAGILLYKKNFSQTREAVLTEYMGYIEKAEYEKMYELLDETSKDEISEEDFITRNKNIYEGIEAEHIQLDIPKEQDKSRPLSYRVSMDTLAGEIRYDTDTFFAKEKGKWYILWEDSMIFPNLGKKDKVSVSSVSAERGSIYDRNDRLLAGQGTVQAIGLVSGKMNVQPEEDIRAIAEILGTTEEHITAELGASWVKADSFVPLKKMTQEQLDEPYQHEGEPSAEESVQDKLLAHAGVLITDAESRVYPYGECTSHLLGYVQQINAEELEEMKKEGYNEQSIIGKSGLEKLYEERLRAKKGYSIVILDEEGNQKEALAMKPAEDGEDIKLSIDIEWQQKLYEAYQQDKSCSVAMNPKSGEVLALVSTPSFDSMDFVLGISQEKWDALNDNPNKPMYNRTRESWTAGSSFKPIIGAIGLTTGSFTAEEDFGNSGLAWQKDESWGNYKVTTLHEYSNAVLKNALVYSDNIYFAKAALKIGADRMQEELERIGFQQEIPFAIGMSSSQYSNSEKIESEIQLADSGYGQGQILVNPLHLACMYSAFFNEGNMISPILEIKESDGQKPSYWVEQAFTKEAAQTIFDDLKEVVHDPNGTGYAAASAAGGTLAGKTGTAEIKTSQEDENGTELGWFAVYNTGASDEETVLMLNMVEDVKGRGGSGYVVNKDVEVWNEMWR